MKNNALSLAQTPPLSIPLRFFLTAPLFAVACGVVLLWFGEEAFVNRWHPGLLAATHFLTLGFLGMIMIGALQQLTPVLMGAQITQPVLFSTTVHLLLTTGTLVLTVGWLIQKPELFTLAAVLLGASISLFIIKLFIALQKARTGYATVYSTRIALLAFATTMLLGIYLLMGYTSTEFSRFSGMTDLHMTWGLLGWVGLLIMGVAYQVVPMFQITPEYPKLMMRWLTLIIFLLLVSWSVVYIFFSQKILLLNIAAGLVVLSLVSFIFITLNLLSRRRRKIPDITLNFWRVAMSSLLIVVVAWSLSLFDIHPRLEFLIGVMMIVGFGMSAVSGMLYKITPFLIWLHLNNYAQDKDRSVFKIPNMKQVIPERKARLHFRVHILMLLLSFLAVFWPGYFLRPAAVVLIITSCILWANLYAALRLYIRVSS